MLILAVLIVLMISVILLGKLRWQKKSIIYVISALAALLQTLFVLYEMLNKKIPLNL